MWIAPCNQRKISYRVEDSSVFFTSTGTAAGKNASPRKQKTCLKP